jgi:hypothetical protein
VRWFAARGGAVAAAGRGVRGGHAHGHHQERVQAQSHALRCGPRGQGGGAHHPLPPDEGGGPTRAAWRREAVANERQRAKRARKTSRAPLRSVDYEVGALLCTAAARLTLTQPSRAHPGQRRLLPASLSSRRPRRLWLCERETARQRRSERDADGRRRGGSTRWTRSCPSSPCSSYRPVARRRPSCRRRVGYRTPTRFDHRLPPSAGARLYLYSLSSTDVNTLGNATSRPCTGGGSRDRLPDSLHLVPASSCTVTSEIATP